DVIGSGWIIRECRDLHGRSLVVAHRLLPLDEGYALASQPRPDLVGLELPFPIRDQMGKRRREGKLREDRHRRINPTVQIGVFPEQVLMSAVDWDSDPGLSGALEDPQSRIPLVHSREGERHVDRELKLRTGAEAAQMVFVQAQ